MPGADAFVALQHLLVATLLIGSPAAPLPAGRYHIGSLGRFIAKLVVMGIVLALAKLEGEALTVGRMLQVLGEIADPCVSLFIDADEHDLPRALLAVELEAEDGRRVNCRRHAGNRVAGDAADLLHVPGGVRKTLGGVRFEHDVGENAVDAIPHLVGEAGHDAVDDDHRRHAEHHADNRSQRDIPRPQIPPAKQDLVHVTPFTPYFLKRRGAENAERRTLIFTNPRQSHSLLAEISDD